MILPSERPIQRFERKLQIFLSSTYKDLKAERQAAVETILESGHIPAGMELFAAGDKSQFEVIKKWIDSSDVFALILGPRYGSLEPESGKSYVQLEYEYAVEINKPLFAVVCDGIRSKKKQSEEDADSIHKYEQFKKKVTSKLCSFYTSSSEIRVGFFRAIKEMELREDLGGWSRGISFDTLRSLETRLELMGTEKAELQTEIDRLKGELSSATASSGALSFNGLTFDELLVILSEKKVDIGEVTEAKKPSIWSLAQLFSWYFEYQGSQFTFSHLNLVTYKASNWYFQNLGKRLVRYGLVEPIKGDNFYSKMVVSPLGLRFLTEYEKNVIIKKAKP